jgi:hypothetical protein
MPARTLHVSVHTVDRGRTLPFRVHDRTTCTNTEPVRLAPHRLRRDGARRPDEVRNSARLREQPAPWIDVDD